MTRRAPIRLVRLLAVACACLVPAAVAHAAVPDNDLPTAPFPVAALGWTSLSVSQDIQVPASDWGEASTGPEDADPLPSCTGAIGFKSMWYAVTVPEAAVLRVTVISTDTARYQPVVTVLDPGRQDELACGVLAVGKAGATATATAVCHSFRSRWQAGGLYRSRRAGHAPVALGQSADADRALRRA